DPLRRRRAGARAVGSRRPAHARRRPGGGGRRGPGAGDDRPDPPGGLGALHVLAGRPGAGVRRGGRRRAAAVDRAGGDRRALVKLGDRVGLAGVGLVLAVAFAALGLVAQPLTAGLDAGAQIARLVVVGRRRSRQGRRGDLGRVVVVRVV